MKKIAISQSNYIPWKGYFDMINMVDEFILYDDVQYTRRDWRNRNKIKTQHGLKWLSIPVEAKGKYFQKINETKISDKEWGARHWSILQQNYAHTKYFTRYKEIFEELYLNSNEEYLSKINYKFIMAINKLLGITTKIRDSGEFNLADGQTERLLTICKDSNADIYLSGPAAKEYFDEDLAQKEGIKVEWMDYSGYREYHQCFEPFEHAVSILDLLFNEGHNAHKFMKSFTKQ
ncbi:WbqC family protein [bacterium]|nr:WbqC family protein [bacterium]MBU1990601.1 WbqC family protein [bacterium]